MLDFTKYLSEDFPYDPTKVESLLRLQNVLILGFSGKKGSGKDTFGRAFMERMEDRYGMAVQTMAFADSLKEEATDILGAAYRINQSGSTVERDAGVADLAKRFNMSYNCALTLVDHLRGEPADSTGWSRTEGVWFTLRYLGTNIRQSQDKAYWVKKAFPKVAGNALNGISTIFTDVRFLHEAQFIHDMNGYLIRIDVSPETQARRLMRRDNLSSTPEALRHPSEVQLDDYTGFHQRIDNNSDGDINALVEFACLDWESYLENNQVGGRQ